MSTFDFEEFSSKSQFLSEIVIFNGEKMTGVVRGDVDYMRSHYSKREVTCLKQVKNKLMFSSKLFSLMVGSETKERTLNGKWVVVTEGKMYLLTRKGSQMKYMSSEKENEDLERNTMGTEKVYEDDDDDGYDDLDLEALKRDVEEDMFSSIVTKVKGTDATTDEYDVFYSQADREKYELIYFEDLENPMCMDDVLCSFKRVEGKRKSKKFFVDIVVEGNIKITFGFETQKLANILFNVLGALGSYTSKILYVTKPPFYEATEKQKKLFFSFDDDFDTFDLEEETEEKRKKDGKGKDGKKSKKLTLKEKLEKKKKKKSRVKIKGGRNISNILAINSFTHFKKVSLSVRYQTRKHNQPDDEDAPRIPDELLTFFLITLKRRHGERQIFVEQERALYVTYLLSLGAMNSASVNEERFFTKYFMTNNRVANYQNYITLNPIRFTIGVQGLGLIRELNRRNEPFFQVSEMSDCTNLKNLEGLNVMLRRGEEGKKYHKGVEVVYQICFSGELFNYQVESEVRKRKKRNLFVFVKEKLFGKGAKIVSPLEATPLIERDQVFSVLQKKEKGVFSLVLAIWDGGKLIKFYQFGSLAKIITQSIQNVMLLKFRVGKKAYVDEKLIFRNRKSFQVLLALFQRIYQNVNPHMIAQLESNVKVSIYDFENVRENKGKVLGKYNDHGFTYFHFGNSLFKINLLKYLAFFHNVRTIHMTDRINYISRRNKRRNNCKLILADKCFFVIKIKQWAFGEDTYIEIIDRNTFSNVINLFVEKKRLCFIFSDKSKVQIELLKEESHPLYLIKILKEVFFLEPSIHIPKVGGKPQGMKEEELIPKFLSSIEKGDIEDLSEIWFEYYEFLEDRKERKLRITLRQSSLLRIIASKITRLRLIRDLDDLVGGKIDEMKKRIFYYSPLTRNDFVFVYNKFVGMLKSLEKIIPEKIEIDTRMEDMFSYLLLQKRHEDYYTYLRSKHVERFRLDQIKKGNISIKEDIVKDAEENA